MVESYDPHELLGVAQGCTEDEIRKAFRRQAKQVHPDVSDAPDAAAQFTRLKAAHDLLIERIENPAAPTPEDLYRPARTVSEDEQELIIQAHRRRRVAEQRRRARRRGGTSGNTRRAIRENERIRAEMARRRAAYEAQQQDHTGGGE